MYPRRVESRAARPRTPDPGVGEGICPHSLQECCFSRLRCFIDESTTWKLINLHVTQQTRPGSLAKTKCWCTKVCAAFSTACYLFKSWSCLHPLLWRNAQPHYQLRFCTPPWVSMTLIIHIFLRAEGCLMLFWFISIENIWKHSCMSVSYVLRGCWLVHVGQEVRTLDVTYWYHLYIILLSIMQTDNAKILHYL